MTNLKSLPIVILFLCVTYIVNGQTEKGKLLLGSETQLNFTSLSYKWKSDDGSGDDGKAFNIDFSPQAGYFVRDNLALGIEFPINYFLEKEDNGDKIHSSSLTFAPFIRNYFGTNSIKPYLHGGIGLGYHKVVYDFNSFYMDPNMNSTWDNKYSMFLYELGGGLAIFLNDKTSMDIGIGYASSSRKSKDDNNNNYRNITNGLGMGIGFVILL